jgi:hypothetical protein
MQIWVAQERGARTVAWGCCYYFQHSILVAYGHSRVGWFCYEHGEESGELTGGSWPMHRKQCGSIRLQG